MQGPLTFDLPWIKKHLPITYTAGGYTSLSKALKKIFNPIGQQ